jgi:hypothetical protein
LYMAGKRFLCSGPFMEEKQQRFKKTVREAKRLILIGVAINRGDDHIWVPVSKSKADIHFVNPDDKIYEDWAQVVGRRAYKLGDTFTESLPRIGRLLGL